MTPRDPATPRTLHIEEVTYNSTEAIKRATSDVIAKGYYVRQVIGARRLEPGGPFRVALVVTGPLR